MSNDEISELEAQLEWYEERGWTNAVEDTKEQIAELEGDTAEVKTDLLSDGEEASGDDVDVAELEERLSWYEKRGWDNAAADLRESIAEAKDE